MKIDDKYQAVIDALNEMFGDRSVPQSKTKELLENVQGEIEIMLESLDDGDDE